MPDAFTLRLDHQPDPQPSDPPRKVLITGAAGRIGSYVAAHSQGRYDLTLLDLAGVDMDDVESLGEVVRCELGDLDGLKAAFAGQDTILHLAANPSPTTPWESALNDNIVGTFNAFVAAEAAGCRRVIYASSIHAISGYPHQRQVHADDPVNPGDLYGVTKCFGEAMGRYMAQQRGLDVIAIRIGAFQPEEKAHDPGSLKMMDAFVSHRDLCQLIQRCIDDETLRFAIFHGLSNNLFNRMDITDPMQLVGYAPQDDFTQLNPNLRDLHLTQTVTDHDEEGGQQSGIEEQVKG